MHEQLNDGKNFQLKKAIAWEPVSSNDRWLFLNELPLVPVYAEPLPHGLIADEI